MELAAFFIAVVAMLYSAWERRLRIKQYSTLFKYITHLVRVNDRLAEKNKLLIIENEELVADVKRLEAEVTELLKTKPQELTQEDQ